MTSRLPHVELVRAREADGRAVFLLDWVGSDERRRPLRVRLAEGHQPDDVLPHVRRWRSGGVRVQGLEVLG